MNSSRRKFIAFAASIPLISAAAILFGRKAMAEERRRGGGATAGGDTALPWVAPGVGQAKALNYVHNSTDLKDAKLKTDRQGVPFAKQHCNNCMLYTKVGTKDGAEAGKCTLFAGQLVKGSGWCTTWNKKV